MAGRATIVGDAFPVGEGDAFIHRLASTSTPYGDEPGPGGDSEGEDETKPPAKAPQGVRQPPPGPAEGDAWLRTAVDEASGGRRWTSSYSEPGGWMPA